MAESHLAAHASQVTFGPTALRTTTATYLFLGVVSSMFGPLLSTIARSFHVSVPDAGLTLSVWSLGGTVGVLLGWWGLRERGGRIVVRVGVGIIASGAAGAALSAQWSTWLAAIGLNGIGFGILNIGLNSLLARTALEGRGSRLSIGNSVYGLGAVAGPLLVVALGRRHFHVIYWLLVPLFLAAMPLFSDLTAPPSRQAREGERPSPGAPRRAVLITFIAAFTFYLAMETTITGWAASTLRGYGYGINVGGFVSAGFWAGFAAGRSLAAVVHRSWSARRIVATCVGAAMVLCPLAMNHVLAPAIFVTLGLAVSATFPMGLMWLSELCPYDSDALALLIVVMGAGGIVGPWIAGRLVASYGVQLVPLAAAVEGLVSVSIFLTARRFSRAAPAVATATTRLDGS